MMRTKKIVRKK